MVGFDSSSKRLSSFEYAIAGGWSGAVTRFLCQPLDVIKIRFQLQVEPIAHGSKYTSLYQATRIILKEESFKALWSGHVPAQFLSISYGLSQFWCYEKLTELCFKSQYNNYKSVRDPIVSFTCGAVAGTFATVLSFPFDTIRTRLVAEEKLHPVYKGALDTFIVMSKNEGFFSFYKGLFPTLAQVAPHTGLQFAFYKVLTNVYNRFSLLQTKVTGNSTEKQEITFVGSLTAGSLAGLSAKTAIYPFDLAKKRLQIQGFQHHRVNFGKQIYCSGFFNCIKSTIKNEGFTGLYKGLVPSLYKAVLVSALHFAIYEETCRLIRSYK